MDPESSLPVGRQVQDDNEFRYLSLTPSNLRFPYFPPVRQAGFTILSKKNSKASFRVFLNAMKKCIEKWLDQMQLIISRIQIVLDTPNFQIIEN